MSPIFADFADILGWACFCLIALMWVIGKAVSSLFQSDAVQNIATDVATDVVTSWLEDLFR